MALLSEEQALLKDQAASWVAEQAPVTSFRAMRDAGEATCFTPTTWQSMIDMGWTGILVPESHGGSDLGYLTFGLVLEQLGRELTAAPLFASAYVGVCALREGGTEAQQGTYLPKVVDGSEILTLAVDEGPRHAPDRIACRAVKTEAGYSLSGSKTFVPEGLAATTFVVAARMGDGDEVGLFLVPADSAGLNRQRLHTFDSRGYANLTLEGVTVGADALLPDGGPQLLDRVLDLARAGQAAEMLGTAAKAFEMTLEYLKTREQFGRVIGSFQALGHRAAELYTEQELSRSCAEAALQALDAGSDDASQLIALSQAKVGAFLHEMSNQLIQIHGGIGMTDEFDAGFYLKRARALETLYGNPGYHRDRYARSLGF